MSETEEKNVKKDYWSMVSKPPKTALKKIIGGRTKGMTDINPQWRYKVMTETYGMCGFGWKYEISKKWQEQIKDEIFVFVEINLYIKINDIWSDPIPGTGGNKLLTKEKNGLYGSDEAYKMATTDALSVALKMIGVGSEIYEGNFDGAKYKTEYVQVISKEQEADLRAVLQEVGRAEHNFCKFAKIFKLSELPEKKYQGAIKWIRDNADDNN